MNLDFESLIKIINQKLEQADYSKEPFNLYEPVRYTLASGGKRIRPALAIMAYSLFKDNPHEIIEPALGIEIFHSFTLVHDDIMDNSQMRRGRKSVYSKWNTNTALLSGDAMYIIATAYLNKTPTNHKELMNAFTDAALKVCEGQQLDMDFEEKEEITEREYINMISLKTGALLAVSPQIGGIMANADKKDISLLHEFGLKLGLAFQLQDDWLDCYADKDKLGKNTGEDIINNKKTYLWIKSRELANEKQLMTLKRDSNNSNIDEQERIEDVINVYNESGAQELLFNKVNQLFEESYNALKKINAEEQRKKELYKILRIIQNRNT